MEYFVYALPLIVVMIISWILQTRNNKTLLKLQKVSTPRTASETVQSLLDGEGLKIQAEKGSDYTQNLFDEAQNKVLLSPDLYDEKDAASIGQAVLAGGTAVMAKKDPGKAASLKKLKSFILIVFWVLFTVLAFGLMGKHLPTVIAGYAILAFMAILYFAEIGMKKGINRQIINSLKQLELFDETQLRQIAKAVDAESMKL